MMVLSRVRGSGFSFIGCLLKWLGAVKWTVTIPSARENFESRSYPQITPITELQLKLSSSLSIDLEICEIAVVCG